MKTFSASLFVLLMSFPIVGPAQENAENEPTLERAESWTELTSLNGVTVQYKHADCSSEKNGVYKENVLLRFSNENEEAVSLEWDHEIWYDGNCRTCDVGDEEYHHQLELEGGEVQEGDCEAGTSQKFQIFARFLKSGNGLPDTELTGLRLADLQVR